MIAMILAPMFHAKLQNDVLPQSTEAFHGAVLTLLPLDSEVPTLHAMAKTMLTELKEYPSGLQRGIQYEWLSEGADPAQATTEFCPHHRR